MKPQLPAIIEKIPLSWATTATHYFENEFGEHWIAKAENNQLLLSGLDIGWDVIALSYQDAINTRNELLKGTRSVNGTNLGEAEIFWVLSVISSSLIRLQKTA